MVGATVVGWTKYLELNTTNAAATASTPWNDTAPTTTTVSLGSSNNGNQSGQTYIMYAFHSVAGFSDIGFWQGGTTTITTGFQPSFVIQQDYGLGGGWGIFDSARSGQVLNANTNAAESSSSFVTFTATGFTVPSETSSVFRLYMAFKENPTPYPLAGNMSFLVVAGGGGGARYGAGGAGGYRNSYANEPSGGNSSSEADISLSAGTYTITIGAGGNGGNRSAGSAGVNSTLSTIIANGGGEGIRWPNNTAQSTQNGGSGGGQDADNSGTNSPGTTVTTNDGKTQGTNGVLWVMGQVVLIMVLVVEEQVLQEVLLLKELETLEQEVTVFLHRLQELQSQEEEEEVEQMELKQAQKELVVLEEVVKVQRGMVEKQLMVLMVQQIPEEEEEQE